MILKTTYSIHNYIEAIFCSFSLDIVDILEEDNSSILLRSSNSRQNVKDLGGSGYARWKYSSRGSLDNVKGKCQNYEKGKESNPRN